MDPELVKLLAGGEICYLVHYQQTYLRIQPAFSGYYQEQLSKSEYTDLKETYTVKKTVPLGLLSNSTEIEDSIKRQLGLEEY